ncbi:MAG: DUF790 family protein [Ktedonobacterales bacterium]
MRLALGEVKKRVYRQNGRTLVSPYLIRPNELSAELKALIDLYDSLLGQPHSSFPEERPAELIGDYRLARCLQACLSEWYEWRSVQWPENATPGESQALSSGGICSPSHLRLALYDYVNHSLEGYVAATDREVALNRFAESIGIARATLIRLLRLDAPGEALLARSAPARPTPAGLAVRYNQRVVETLLSNAAHIEWILPATMTDGAGGGLGSVVKRVCFLARRMGIRYDVAFVPGPSHPDPSHPDAGPSPSLETRSDELAFAPLQTYGLAVSILLYGPPEVMGAPSQYGERLARLARALLGYRRSGGTGTPAHSTEDLRGMAEIYLYGRPAQFRMDARLLKLLGRQTDNQDEVSHGPAFDSSLEHDLHADFAALSAVGEARGWQLEREPEPLLVGDTILVPDFALTRGRRRVYLEIAGYWRPGYRERKVRKLAALRRKVNMIVAAPESARAEFSGLVNDFPFLWYSTHPRAQAVLEVLEREFNDRRERLAALDIAGICREVARRRCIPSRESMALLHVYSRSELALALARIPEGPGGVVWLEGIGLCSGDWCHALLAEIGKWVSGAPGQRMELTALRQLIATEVPGQGELGGPEAELLATMSGCTVLRASIFDVDVLAPGVSPEPLENPPESPARMLPTQPRTALRRKHSRAKYKTPAFFPIEPAHDSQ